MFRNNVKVKIPDRSKLHLIFYLIKISLNSHILHVPNGTYKIVIGSSEVVFMPEDEDGIYRTYILSCLHKKLNIKFYPENSCKFYFKGKKVIYFFNPEDFTSIANLYTTFVDEHYRVLDVRKKIVADVGASYGDTAIYFALKGAKKVYAYEPIPWVVKILEKNVRLNNLSDVIKIYPYAVSLNEGKARLTVPKTETDAASFYYDRKNVEVARILVRKVTPPLAADVLKMNCEGCEYDIILRWLKHKIYEEILVKYHEDYKQLVKRLKELGYKVKVLQHTRMLIAN